MSDELKERANNIDHLNELLEKNYDAEKGYKQAADNVTNTVVEQWLRRQSKMRYDFGHEIKGEISRLGGKPDKGGSATGVAHRAWIEIKNALSANSDKAVLDECIRGERASLEDYEEALLEAHVPQETKDVLKRQHDRIEGSIAKLDVLESALEQD